MVSLYWADVFWTLTALMLLVGASLWIKYK